MDGLLLIDKPAGLSSHDVVARMRRVAGQKQAGHAGTLDPNATGLLVLAMGSATRWLPYLPTGKAYRATVKLGLATDTEDIWGSPTAQAPVKGLDAGALRKAIEGLRHLREQVPPMVSALKKDGRRLYELAREGIEVERPPRPITISAIRVLDLRADEADFELECSGGTYVRSLCVAVGHSLGLPACMSALRRLGSGVFSVDGSLDEARWDREALEAALLGPEKALAHLPVLEMDEAGAADIRHGRKLLAPQGSAEGDWRLNQGGKLVALARLQNGSFQPERVLG